MTVLLLNDKNISLVAAAKPSITGINTLSDLANKIWS